MLFVMLFILELRTEMCLMQNSKRWTLHHGFLSKYLYVSLTTSLCASTVGFDKSIIGLLFYRLVLAKETSLAFRVLIRLR